MLNRMINLSRNFFLPLVIIYTLIAVVYILNLSGIIGDEAVFIRDLNYIQELGWIEAIKLNVSIPYMIIMYPFTFVFDNLIALRLANWVVVILMFIYFMKQKKSKWFYGYLLFYLSTTLFFFRGTNDALFSSALIIFLNEIYMLQRKEKNNLTLALIALLITSFTRTIFIVFLPVVIYGLYIAYNNRKFIKVKWLYPTVTLIILVAMNLPSIIDNGKLSYDRKSPPKEVNVTWTQKQYLAQLMVNDGKIANFSHPSWAQTEAYLQKNGEDSLPNSTLAGVFLDVKLTTKEFFKDLYYSLFFGFRQIGLVLFITIFLLLREVYKKKRIDSSMYIPLSLLAMLCAFSLIIISYIEARWLAPVFIMALVFYSDIEKELKIPKSLILSNYLVFILLTLYGGFRLFNKI